MPTDVAIERRLAAVERAVAEIQHRLETQPSSSDWLQQMTGSFKDEPAFAEVLEFGRAIRAADRPPEDAGS
jgi:hypothetical protein